MKRYSFTLRVCACLFAVTALLCRTPSTIAQTPITATFAWEVSADGGATWQRGTVGVPQSQSSVLVRAWVGWNRDLPSQTFSQCQFDATVTTPGRQSADIIDHVNEGNAGWWSQNGGQGIGNFGITAFADVQKIDDIRDIDAPGQGPRWISPLNLSPVIGGLHEENPAIVFNYRLTLDGMAGDRHIGAIFRVLDPQNPDRLVRIYTDGVSPANVPTTVLDAVVTVIPAPTTAFLFGASTLLISSRRRRSLRSWYSLGC